MPSDVFTRLADDFARRAARDPDRFGAWQAAIPAMVDVAGPEDLVGAVRRWNQAGDPRVDVVLGGLLRRAQAGDDLAAAAVLVVLTAGLREVARRLAWRSVTVDDVAADAAELVHTCWLTRPPRAVARTLIRQVQLRLTGQATRRDRADLAARRSAGDWRSATCGGDPAAGLELVEQWRSARLSPEERTLIVQTRLLDVSVEEFASTHGVAATAVYKRRARAEARLAAAA